MHIRIVRKPPIRDLDGVTLDYFEPGHEYELGSTLAAVFLSEGWAEPVPFRNIKKSHPSYPARPIAADRVRPPRSRPR